MVISENLFLYLGDITEIKTEALVNPANTSLLGVWWS